MGVEEVDGVVAEGLEDVGVSIELHVVCDIFQA